MAGKFIIDKAKNGFKFNLVAGNGEIIATSEVYESKAGVENGIESVRKNSVAEIEDQTLEGFALWRQNEDARLPSFDASGSGKHFFPHEYLDVPCQGDFAESNGTLSSCQLCAQHRRQVRRFQKPLRGIHYPG